MPEGGGPGATSMGGALKSRRGAGPSDARVVDLLFRRQLQDQRHQQALRFHPPRGALFEHLLEQNPLVGHVLVDDPQAIAPGGDDEALVDLPERAQIA